MKYPFYIVVMAAMLISTGCVKSPEDWFLNFQGMDGSCLLPGASDILQNLDYPGRQKGVSVANLFQKSMLRIFDNQDIRRKPMKTEHPDYATLYSARAPDSSLFLRRKGWSYCLDIVLSGSLFSPLRKVRY